VKGLAGCSDIVENIPVIVAAVPSPSWKMCCRPAVKTRNLKRLGIMKMKILSAYMSAI
jgi:hypothetical protein